MLNFYRQDIARKIIAKRYYQQVTGLTYRHNDENALFNQRRKENINARKSSERDWYVEDRRENYGLILVTSKEKLLES